MPKVTVSCGTCGKDLLRQPYQVVARKRHFCDRTCWARAPERITAPRDLPAYYCPKCEKHRPRDEFIWNVVGGVPRRRGYCLRCAKKSRKAYHKSHRDQSKRSHQLWREASKEAGGERTLLWLFTRRLGPIRSRSRLKGLPACNLDSRYLLEVYFQQQGRCYFTGEPLTPVIESKGDLLQAMSVDRLDPSKGYVRGNVVLCSYDVNTCKGSRTEDQFYALCERILQIRDSRRSSA